MDIIGRKQLNKLKEFKQDYTMTETSYSINKSTNNNDIENESAMELVAPDESDSVILS
jgi:hypothetical protein